MTDAFNPLAIDSLASSIVQKMSESEAMPLGGFGRFRGAGVYALYYNGDFDAYTDLSFANATSAEVPIYVGKAVPAGGRKGLDVSLPSSTTALASRLREHASSVRSAENLDLDHFLVRWLVIDDIWIPLGESALIRRHRPVWNAVVDGFGNHDPGKGRINGVRSRWDTLHPGRPGATKYPERPETPEDVTQEVIEYLRSRLA